MPLGIQWKKAHLLSELFLEETWKDNLVSKNDLEFRNW